MVTTRKVFYRTHMKMYLVKKGDIKCAELLAKAQHLLLELMKIHLLDDSVFVILLSDETHKCGFLQRTPTDSSVM